MFYLEIRHSTDNISLKTSQSPQHIAEETCLRQFRKSSQALMELAMDAGFDSSKLEYLLSLLPKSQTEYPDIDTSDDEEVKFSILYLNFIFEGIDGNDRGGGRSNC